MKNEGDGVLECEFAKVSDWSDHRSFRACGLSLPYTGRPGLVRM